MSPCLPQVFVLGRVGFLELKPFWEERSETSGHKVLSCCFMEELVGSTLPALIVMIVCFSHLFYFYFIIFLLILSISAYIAGA
jgi:hypothetical protein